LVFVASVNVSTLILNDFNLQQCAYEKALCVNKKIRGRLNPIMEKIREPIIVEE
jgi:hypothetical protein